jgi:hypothetical protein
MNMYLFQIVKIKQSLYHSLFPEKNFRQMQINHYEKLTHSFNSFSV